MTTLLLMETLLRHWTICDNLWLVENILQNACLYERWISHSSDPEFGRIDKEKTRSSCGCFYADFWINCALLRSFWSGRGEILVMTSKGFMSSDNSQHYSITATFSRYGLQLSVRRYSSLPWVEVRALNILQIILGFYTCVVRNKKCTRFTLMF